MTYNTPITDADLHAYVDEQLAPGRRKEVEHYLSLHPEAMALTEEYRRMNQGLHELFDPVLDEPVPAQLAVSPVPRGSVYRVAAVVAWMAIGGVIGWILHPPASHRQQQVVENALVQPAAYAHAVYSVEVKHPVEVSAEHEKHLVAWLSRRLQANVQAPDLQQQGFHLVGGRLLPSNQQLAAQFMYERSDGRRITLYIRHGTWEPADTSFRYAHIDRQSVFYWTEGTLGYALVGDLQRNDMLSVSEAVYHHLQP